MSVDRSCFAPSASPQAVVVRGARPADVDMLVPLAYASGPEAFDYVFAPSPQGAQGFLRAALAEGRGLLGWPRHRVAVVNDQVVACVALYSGSELAALARTTLFQYFRLHAPWTAFAVMRRAFRVGAMQPPPAHSDLYIAHLSVSAEFRRRGIGTLLVQHALAVARERGHRHCTLDVAHGNAAALALYAAHGFERLGERALPGGSDAVPASQRFRLSL